MSENAELQTSVAVDTESDADATHEQQASSAHGGRDGAVRLLDNRKVDVKKTYYSISEVCKTTGLEPHVLRYWESEFPQLRPKKNRAGNRAYRGKDIEVIEFIKQLLYGEQYTIPGAKKKLAGLHTADMLQTELPLSEPATVPAPVVAVPDIAMFREVAADLRKVLEFIRS